MRHARLEFPHRDQPAGCQELKIYHRELIRLEMSLEAAAKSGLPILAMTHYPPLLQDYQDTEFSALMEKYNVSHCVYGHLHGVGIANGFNGAHRGVEYRLVSCDAIDFSPVKICG